MPEHNPDVPPPFDQGVFLLHYNRGRKSFEEGRYAEARPELEVAQRLRADDADVLNLLGLVYFKTNAYPEAEVIYRRLAKDNPSVFILHSNLGLILFKQRKFDDAETHLLRAIELRPNYSKSHLYLGLLYKERGKFGPAMEHLQFAGAEKIIREMEASNGGSGAGARKISAPGDVSPVTSSPTPSRTMAGSETVAPDNAPPEPFAQPQIPPLEESVAGTTAARKLREAVDDPPPTNEARLDLKRKIEGASRTFALHENGFLEINFKDSVHVKRGTVSSYSGNLKFAAESVLSGTTAQTLVKATGEGRIFVYEKGRKTFLLDLNEEFIYVEGSNLLALEDSLSYRVEPIYDASYQKKIDTVKIFGKGSLAISTLIEPMTLRVTREYPLSISSHALVAWTGRLVASVIDDRHLENVMIESVEGAFKIRFEGDGVVVSEQ
ncbi:MAG TPA: tetratricopeptide repeat protein [Thermoanaerobaculia bacterium]|nr:tetratricopeptide repeat protein [Thermoanaerobaculia bacterium]